MEVRIASFAIVPERSGAHLLSREMFTRQRTSVLVVTVPAERRLAGECPTRLFDDGGECHIIPKRVVVDEILVAERETEDALTQQVWQRVLDSLCHPVIGKTTRQSLNQS